MIGWRRLRPGARDVGRRGERIAARWLRRRGYRILARNLRIGADEADLLVLDPDRDTIAVVEVKTRTDVDAAPEQRIDARKQWRLARLASRLQRRPEYAGHPLRFDAVSVILVPSAGPVVRHYPAAFESPI